MQNRKNNLAYFKGNSITSKIIKFFKNIFFKKKKSRNSNLDNLKKETKIMQTSSFINNNPKENININLLESFRNGEIDEEEMTDEQFECLCNMYKAKISQLKENNRIRKNKLLSYRRKIKIV